MLLRRTRTLFDLLREISLDEVRENALRPVKLAVSGASRQSRAAIVDLLTGGMSGPGTPVSEHDPSEGPSALFERASLVVYALGSGQVRQTDVDLMRSVAAMGKPVVAVTRGGAGLVGDSSALDGLDDLLSDGRYRIRLVRLPAEGGDEGLLRAILNFLGPLDLAAARQLPVFRPIVAAKLIGETSRANAEFALVSNLPEVIPVVGNIVTAGADLLVLTKNQVMLVFKIAAVYGADIRSGTRVLAELLPVVGASFFWRSLARELAALVPFGIGALPKTVIAYAGTYAAGLSAQYYYSTGSKPDRELMVRFYREALEKARSLLQQRLGGPR